MCQTLKSMCNVKSKSVNSDSLDTSENEGHGSTDVDEGHNTEGTVDVDEENKYESLKAMADADHKVSTTALLSTLHAF